MSLDLLNTKGTPPEKQILTWREMVRAPISKLDVDAFTRIRVILMNGIEMEALTFSHACARMNRELQPHLALIRRAEQHQATAVNWLLPSDQSPIETTIAYEQVAVEITAAVGRREPDPYLQQVYKFGLLEDFDHLYRYTALLDRLEGKDSNNILQSYTDIHPGRPTVDEHRHPLDDLRNPYDKRNATAVTKMNALTIMAAEQQTHNYYMNIGPLFSDPIARQLYAEIASVEEQHVTQYESIIDPTETWMEKWLMHEANEAYNYWSCVETESDPKVKALWERFLDYELGQLQVVSELFKKYENRDPAEVLGTKVPEPIPYSPQRDYVRSILDEVSIRADGPNFVTQDREPQRSLDYRAALNADGNPSEAISEGYVWSPGGELARRAEKKPMMQHKLAVEKGAHV